MIKRCQHCETWNKDERRECRKCYRRLESLCPSDATDCSPSSAHDKAWEKGFIVPIAKEMKARGVAYMLITIRDDGKAAYVLEPNEPECIKCAQNGWSNERNGPCPKFPNCEESFPENV